MTLLNVPSINILPSGRVILDMPNAIRLSILGFSPVK